MSRLKVALIAACALGPILVGPVPAQAASTQPPPAARPVQIVAPGAPVISHLTAIGAVVSWTPSPSSGVSLYILETLVNGEWTAVGISGLPPDAPTSMSVKLQPATTYTYAVVAEDSNGHASPRSATTTFTTPARDTALACKVDFYSIVLTTTTFYANVWLYNTSSYVVTDGWTMTFGLPGDEAIDLTTVFGAVVTQSGANVTVTNNPWNKFIDAFSSTGFGFRGSYTGTFAEPTAFTVNGIACAVA